MTRPLPRHRAFQCTKKSMQQLKSNLNANIARNHIVSKPISPNICSSTMGTQPTPVNGVTSPSMIQHNSFIMLHKNIILPMGAIQLPNVSFAVKNSPVRQHCCSICGSTLRMVNKHQNRNQSRPRPINYLIKIN